MPTMFEIFDWPSGFLRCWLDVIACEMWILGLVPIYGVFDVWWKIVCGSSGNWDELSWVL